MKFLSFLALSVACAMASPFPTTGSNGELSNLFVRDMSDDAKDLAEKCAKDGTGAATGMKKGAEDVKKDYSKRVHDEVKRDIARPNEERSIGGCFQCVSLAMMRRYHGPQEHSWEQYVEYSAMDCNPNECSDEEMVDTADFMLKVAEVCIWRALQNQLNGN